MKSTPPWILAFYLFVSFPIVAYSVQVVADAGNSGAISIDCGVPEESWDDNKFYYKADDGNVVEFGEIHNVSSEYMLNSQEQQVWKQLNTLRSFPEGKRNCYSLKPEQGKDNNYLIRAYYIYGNYDNKNSVPEFEFHLGVNFWTESAIDSVDDIVRMEVIHVSATDIIDVCLINTDQGTPFISLLELWPLKKTIYQTSSNLLPLDLMTRRNLGMSEVEGVRFIRYPDDSYGRSWFDRQIDNTEQIRTFEAIDSDATDYKLPNEVLSTAIQSGNGSSALVIHLGYSTKYEYYVYLHFYDFVEHPQNQLRKMDISFNDTNRVPLTLKYRELQTILRIIPKGVSLDNISITPSSGSDIPPMINAYEIFRVLPQPYSPTHEADVDAMRNIKQAYNIVRNDWQGDPCVPRDYRWEGLNCSSDNIPRVTSLNLSSSKLNGEINTSFSNLINLESLDLSNNQLTGEIPSTLAELPNLKLLNLTGNNLRGSIPKALREKSGLILSVERNPGLCQIDSCKTNTQKPIIRIIASVVASAVLVIVACISVMFYKYKRNKQSDMESRPGKKEGHLKSKNRAFSHAEVHSITNNFETVIGEGGFGKVYLGTLQDGAQVAVKLLSKSSQQGFKEFRSEAELLTIVHHRNLVSLVGYCDDGDMKALIYEYMTEGNLRYRLSDISTYVLKWNERLQIALDAACGLDYLHNGCKPPIIHRDLKTSNILLGENTQAKISDFGLSRVYIDTYISTQPAGTIGYLDPEFYSSGNLNKKSDVYSFGIILLELITGQPARIVMPRDTSCHISEWVSPKLQNADLQSIMDPRLEGNFSSESAWKFLEIAVSCIPPAAIQRPDISHVVNDLKECLALQLSVESVEGNSRMSSTTFDISKFSLDQSAPYAR